MFFDIRYLIYMLPAFLLTMIAQFYVKSAYSKWSQVQSRSGVTGAGAAQRLISANGLYGVTIQGTPGQLSDHYDPRDKVLRLSQEVGNGSSVASLAIAAHELGHALQDHEGYGPMRLRSFLVPAVNIGSSLGWILIMAGLLLNFLQLAWLGVILFSAGAVFALATLPVELNASARAKRMLADSGMVVDEEERRGVNNVLNAAAMTYVAALATSIMQVLYFVTMLGGGRRRS